MSRIFNETNNKQENHLKINTFVHTFSHPDEREEYFKMLQIGAKFDMRPRAIFYFYGRDLIAYKCKHPKSPHVNDFLRIFSAYLTNQLEDNCPRSWEECSPDFWEEFILTSIPNYIKLSNKQQETKVLLNQLIRFVHWLDKSKGCAWRGLVEGYVKDYSPQLNNCEAIINELLGKAFPNLLEEDGDFMEDFSQVQRLIESRSETVNSVFEVSKISDSIVTLYDIATTQTYQLINFPSNKLSKGILLDGVIGRSNDDMYWNWYLTFTVYPNKAQKYIVFVD